MSAFLLIGERLNVQRERIQAAVLARDAVEISREVHRQVRCGATHLDVCAGQEVAEASALVWMLETIVPQLPENVGIVVDSSRRACWEAALEILHGRSNTILNSCAATKDAQDDASRECIELAATRGASAMVLLAPADSSAAMLERAVALQKAMDAARLPPERRVLDPQILPLAFDAERPRKTLKLVSDLKARWPHTRVAAGISNVSYNLPARGVINAHYMTMLMAAGLDAVVCDPCSRNVRQALAASRAILGMDDFFADYLENSVDW